MDSCVDYLRRNYREYGRKQQVPFRKLVVRAIQVLKKKRSPLHRESKLQRQEEQHSRRFRLEVSSNGEDLTSTTNDSSDEYSEGFEDRGLSDGENKESFVSGGGEGIEESGGEEMRSGKKGKFSGVRVFQGSDAGRQKGKSGFSSDKLGSGSYSADEDEVMGFSSTFNLLNSSLRSTYQCHPALFNEKPDMDGPKKLSMEEEQKHPKLVTPTVETKQVQAFAAPSAVAAAARAAIKATKKCSKQSDGSISSGNAPVTALEVKNLLVADVLIKPEHTSKIIDGRSEMIDTETHVVGKTTERSIGKTAERDVVKNERAEKPGSRKRTRVSEGQEKESTSFSAEAVRFSDLGGIDSVLGLIREITFPLYNPGIYSWLGLQPIVGVLLHGPPGCGKTKLANAIAYETGLPFLKISAPEVVSGMSGESEAKVRGLFAEAARLAPCIIFIDEIDCITSKRENAQREMERRIVTQLMTCMDELSQSCQRSSDESCDSLSALKSKGHVLVIGATNRPEALDPALRRPGRFDREILLGVPDENGRAQILSVLAKHLRLEGSFDFKRIARCTPGFVGADLAALTREAGSIAIKRIVFSRDPNFGTPGMSKPMVSSSDEKAMESPHGNVSQSDHGMDESMETTPSYGDNCWKEPWTQKEMHALSITMQDFEEAVAMVQPSTKREGFSAIPDVKWEDVGALGSVQKSMEFFISRRIKHPEDYEVLGLDMDTGFLLYGPPGCGKTLVAKAVANDAQANFIYIKGPELLNKYVGESEHAVRVLFSRARSCAPCILFFDEMDALAPRRGMDGNAVAERVLNQLLSEMDGAEKRKGVFMIGATNRPDMIDPAVLRPGRLGKLLYVPLPDGEGRLSILKTLTLRKPISLDVDLASIAANKLCEGLSGADLAALVNEACVAALQEKCMSFNSTSSGGERLEPLLVYNRHFETALSQISPSVSKQDLLYYEGLPKKFNRMPGMKGIASETFI